MNRHISDFHIFDTLFFFFVEIERQHIAGFQTETFQILAKLLFAFFIVGRAVPDFQLDDKLFAEIIDDYIGTKLVSRLSFNVEIAGAVDDRLEIKQELFSPVLLFELLLQRPENLCIGFDESVQDSNHIPAVCP